MDGSVELWSSVGDSPCVYGGRRDFKDPPMATLKASSNDLFPIWEDQLMLRRLLVILVTTAAYFAVTFLGQQMKLRILCEKLLVISQRFFGIPPFRFYALADGIRRILSQATFSPPETPPPSLQLELTLGWQG